jgi:DNA-binding CsgD family transcriptional regulator
MRKPIWAIKLNLWCKNNGYTAQDIADILHLQRGTVYGYWSGLFAVPDENKKKLELAIGLPIYEIFFDTELK